MGSRLARYALIWVAILATVWLGERLARVYLLAADTPRPVAPRGDMLAQEAQTIAVFEAAAPSVAYIFTEDAQGRAGPQGGTGSGVVWDRAGHIVTNFHVVEGASRVRVRLDGGQPYDGRVIGVAPDHDLAVVRILGIPPDLTPIPVGTSADLKVGQTAYAIGNPFGLSRSLSSGIISALGRRLPTASGREIPGVIQTDAAINPGNSGGPLLDSAGRLIGVATAIVSASGTSAGVGFAVPVDTVNRIVPQLIRTGRVPRPGIGILVAPDELAARYGVGGLIVAGVRPGSPAADAGLRPLDRQSGRLGDVITHVAGRPVETFADLAAALDEFGIGKSVDLAVIRDGRSRTVTLPVIDIGEDRNGQ